MVFPLYKEWMGEASRVGDAYVRGVKEFSQFARNNLDSDEFSCPCRKCRNGKCLHFKTVELHLVQWGFMDGYVFWFFHGERDFPFVPEKLTKTKEFVFVEGDPFVDREATTEKLNQRLKAQENRSKKKDDHYLGRTSYAEMEEKLQGEKRKADRVEMYVDARQNPKTKAFHPGAVSDVEKLLEIRSTQDEATRKNIDTDALTVHFGKDKKGRVRGVGSTVSRTSMKATMTLRDELEMMKESKQSTDDKISDIHRILKTLLVNNTSCMPANESRGSHTPQNCVDKSFTDPSPSTPTSRDKTNYKILKLNGSKAIAIATIVKTSPGEEVHHRPMLPFEVKLSVFKVFPEMKNEPIWKDNQGGQDTIGAFEGGFLVWPKYLIEEVVEET